MNTASMNTANQLTIVIPAKNEVKLIPQLLTSLMNQDYSKMSSTRVWWLTRIRRMEHPRSCLAFATA